MAARIQSISRAGLLRRAERLRDEIALTFSTADHWNRSVRKPGEEPIDPDPDGALMRYLCALSHLLEREMVDL